MKFERARKTNVKGLCLGTGMLAVGLTMAACGSGGAHPAEGTDSRVVLQVSHNQATETAQHQVLMEVADRIDAETDGSVKLEIFADSALGPFGDIPDQFMAGAPIIGAVNAPVTANYGVPDLAALNVPYVFDEPSDINAFVESDLWDKWDQDLRDQGFVMIAFNWYQGERHIISTDPEGYPQPADMAGDSIRIPGGENWAAFFGDLPISAQTMDGGEVYTAMQQGVINGAEGPYAQMIGWSLDELGTSITLTSHNFDISGWATGIDTWSSLSSEQQEIVQDAFLWGGQEFSQRTVDNAEELREQLEQEGINFVEADKAAYKNVAQEAITQARFPKYGNVIEEIREAVES